MPNYPQSAPDLSRGLQTHYGPLEISLLVYRALAIGSTRFENEYRLVGPLTARNERPPGLWVHKDVVENVVIHLHGGVVTHIESRRQVNPFTVVRRKSALSVSGVFRARSWRRRRLRGNSPNQQKCRAKYRKLRRSAHICSIRTRKRLR